jgi:hypothetical protein
MKAMRGMKGILIVIPVIPRIRFIALPAFATTSCRLSHGRAAA